LESQPLLKLFSKDKSKITENKTACSISRMTVGVLSGYNYLSTFLTRNTASISCILSNLSRCEITVINGKLKILANSKEFLDIDLFSPETTHKAYSGKNEHKLNTIKCSQNAA